MAASMSAARSNFDDRLDEWGSRLFNVSRGTPPRPRRTKRTPLGSTKTASGCIKPVGIQHPRSFLPIARRPADSHVLTSYRCLTLIVTVP
jgi:hypothetical protein